MENTPIFLPNHQQMTEQEAEAWAAELDEQCARARAAGIGNIDRGGWRMLQEYKMSEEYNQWHTLDDQLSTLALLRGIHNIQESTKARTGSRNGSGPAEKRFLDAVCDRFNHKRFVLN